MNADRRQRRAAHRVRDRGADDPGVPLGLRLLREVHEIAPTARFDVGAGRSDPRGAGLDHAQHAARSRLRAGVDLDLDHVPGRRALHEHHLAARPPRDARAAGGEALDPQLFARSRLRRGPSPPTQFIFTFWEATCPLTTFMLTTLLILPFFRTTRWEPGVTCCRTTGAGPSDLPWSTTSSQYGVQVIVR
jgi:hypothetical protein